MTDTPPYGQVHDEAELTQDDVLLQLNTDLADTNQHIAATMQEIHTLQTDGHDTHELQAQLHDLEAQKVELGENIKSISHHDVTLDGDTQTEAVALDANHEQPISEQQLSSSTDEDKGDILSTVHSSNNNPTPHTGANDEPEQGNNLEAGMIDGTEDSPIDHYLQAVHGTTVPITDQHNHTATVSDYTSALGVEPIEPSNDHHLSDLVETTGNEHDTTHFQTVHDEDHQQVTDNHDLIDQEHLDHHLPDGFTDGTDSQVDDMASHGF
jgi:hypothetical protein